MGLDCREKEGQEAMEVEIRIQVAMVAGDKIIIIIAPAASRRRRSRRRSTRYRFRADAADMSSMGLCGSSSWTR